MLKPVGISFYEISLISREGRFFIEISGLQIYDFPRILILRNAHKFFPYTVGDVSYLGKFPKKAAYAA